MTGIVKLVVDYGANVNTWNTLHYCARSNDVLVSTLISLGANTKTLAWDFHRGVKNTPLHRTTDMSSVEVFEALVAGDSSDFDISDSSGASPLMALMKAKSLLHSDGYILERFSWLVGRKAS